MRRYIKSWLVAFILGLTLPLASAQLITTGGTVTDSDSQTWNNGTWSATPVQTISSGPLYYNGVPISMAMVSGSLDGTGTFSTSALYNTSSLTPAGAEYRFIICPNATATCATIVTPVTITDLSAILSAQVQAPRFLASSTARGYLDIEVLNKYVQGATYYNVTMLSSRTWNGTAWVDSGGSGSGTVQAAPQFRHYIQPNAGTVAVAGPSTTVTNAVDPIAQGIGNTDLFTTGGGNNGIANYFTTYPTGFAAVQPVSTDTESQVPTLPVGSTLIDYRFGSTVSTYNGTGNPAGLYCGGQPAGSQVFPVYSIGECRSYILPTNQLFKTGQFEHTFVAGAGASLGGGGSSAQGWTTYLAEGYIDDFWQRGIHDHKSGYVTCHAIGDCFYDYINGVISDGGSTANSDEGTGGIALHVGESTSYFHGTCTTGCTSGSVFLTTTNTSGQNNFTDGTYLLDVTQGNSAYDGILSTYGATIENLTIANVAFSVPVSTAWGVLTTGTTSTANGLYQIPVSQTVSVNLGYNGPTSPGPFVVGSACIASSSGFMEEIQITAVGTPVSTIQSITFNTRYGYSSVVTTVMQGGLCGQFMTPTGSSWQSGALVMGAYTTSELAVAACLHGNCFDDPGSIISHQMPAGNSVTLYPSAEIIGTNMGQNNQVQLAYNQIPFATNDVIIDPHSAAVNMTGMYIDVGQTTPINGTGINPFSVNYRGPASLAGNSNGYIGSFTSQVAVFGILTFAPSNYTIGFNFNQAPISGGTLLAVDGADVNVGIYTGPLASSGGTEQIFAFANNGGYLFTTHNGSLLANMTAANIPAPSNTLGQIPVVTSATPGSVSYNPVTMTGDCTLNSTGVITCTPHLTATTSVLTGIALTATCESVAVTVTGAVVGHTVSVSSTTGVDIGGPFNIRASVTATNAVTVYVCGTGTPASLAYNVSTY